MTHFQRATAILDQLIRTEKVDWRRAQLASVLECVRDMRLDHEHEMDNLYAQLTTKEG